MKQKPQMSELQTMNNHPERLSRLKKKPQMSELQTMNNHPERLSRLKKKLHLSRTNLGIQATHTVCSNNPKLVLLSKKLHL